MPHWRCAARRPSTSASGTARRLPCSAGPDSPAEAIASTDGASARKVGSGSRPSNVVSPASAGGSGTLRGYFSMVCCTTAVIASGENGLVM